MRKKLDTDNQILIRFVKQPSFEPEVVLTLWYDRETGEQQCEISSWMFVEKSFPVRFTKKSLDTILSDEVLEEFFGRKKHTDLGQLDGNSYEVTVKQGKRKKKIGGQEVLMENYVLVRLLNKKLKQYGF